MLSSEGLKNEDASGFAPLLHNALVRQAISNKIRRRRFTNSYSMLASLKPTSYPLHAASVSHMQFSPDGKHLATCRQASFRFAFMRY